MSARAEVLRRQTFDINALQRDASNLFHLLFAANDALNEMDFGRDGSRNHELDHVAALVRLGYDQAEALSANIDAHWRHFGARVAD